MAATSVGESPERSNSFASEVLRLWIYSITLIPVSFLNLEHKVDSETKKDLLKSLTFKAE